MNDYYFHCSIPQIEHPLNEQGRIWFDSLKVGHWNIPRQYISKSVLNFFPKIGLDFFDAEVFSLPANYQLQIHVDATYMSRKCKLNWAYSEGQHYNVWYTPNKKWSKIATAEEQSDGNYDDYSFVFELDEVDEVARTVLKNPTAVVSGQPHSVITTTHPRKSISVTLMPKGKIPAEKDWGIPIDEMRNYLKDYIIND